MNVKKKKPSIGFIGCGNMAQAIVYALSENGYHDIFVHDSDASQTAKVKEFACAVNDNQEVLNKSEYVFLCVKPQTAKTAVGGLNFSGKILISIMAGTPVSKLQEWTNAKKLVRVMPNLNAAVRLSYNAYVCNGLSDSEKSAVHEMLSAFGLAAETDEVMLNAVTGIAGSGPAYVFRFFRGLLQEAQKHGFSPTAAIEMCGMMIAGSVGNVLHSVFKDMPADFNEAMDKLDAKTDSVCSKGGTTIEGIQFLDSRDFSHTVAEAAARAIQRAEELSK